MAASGIFSSECSVRVVVHLTPDSLVSSAGSILARLLGHDRQTIAAAVGSAFEDGR
jgi:hypothetical protein